MLRWTLLLCFGIYLTLQIAGDDRGQKRAGLVEAEKQPAVIGLSETAATPVPAAQGPVATPTDPRLVEVAFTPNAPLVSPAAQRAPEAEPAPASAAEDLGQIMYVAGRSVNVRGGPSTNNPVVGRLGRGEAVLVVWVEGNGWARVRVEGDGIDGYISAGLLTDQAP